MRPNKPDAMTDNHENELEGQNWLELSATDHSFELGTPVRFSRATFSVYDLLRMVERGRIDLMPDFQRNDAWNDKQRSELIESALLDVPLPLIYLFENELGVRQVIDGMHRINTFRRFLHNDFALQQLTLLPQFNGKLFSDLEPFLQAKLEEVMLDTHIVQPPTPEYMKFLIFERVNRGGVTINKQEMRYALYLGKVTTLLEEMAHLPSFIEATDNSVKPDRKKDQFLILRFIGFYLYSKGYLKGYTYRADMDEFLSLVMRFINTKAPDSLIDDISCHFEKAMSRASALGREEDVFRLPAKQGGNRRPVNVALFEMLSLVLGNDELENISFESMGPITHVKERVGVEERLLSSADSKDNYEWRIQLAEELIVGLRNDH